MELYLKFIMRFMALIAFIGFIGVLIYALKTEKEIETPAQTAQGMVGGDAANALEKEQSALDIAHRTEKELKNWVTMVVSESLSAPRGDLKQMNESVRPYFTASGFAAYQAALENSGITEAVRNNNVSVSVLVEEKPLLLNATAVEDVYRWLFDMPIIISYLPIGTQNLIGNDQDSNTTLSLRVQMRRVPYAVNREGVQVEGWTLTARR